MPVALALDSGISAMMKSPHPRIVYSVLKFISAVADAYDGDVGTFEYSLPNLNVALVRRVLLRFTVLRCLKLPLFSLTQPHPCMHTRAYTHMHTLTTAHSVIGAASDAFVDTCRNAEQRLVCIFLASAVPQPCTFSCPCPIVYC